MPTSVRAAGALTTAEVGGNDKETLFGGNLTVKRPFVDYIFIYEYDKDLSAEIYAKSPRCPNERCGPIYADQNCHPHLIFNVRPTGNSVRVLGQDVQMNPNDQSCQKYHATATFELLRQALQLKKNSPAVRANPNMPPDIAVYHGQEDVSFDCGDTGLDVFELGLKLCDAEPGKVRAKGTKLPSCAGGGIVLKSR